MSEVPLYFQLNARAVARQSPSLLMHGTRSCRLGNHVCDAQQHRLCGVRTGSWTGSPRGKRAPKVGISSSTASEVEGRGCQICLTPPTAGSSGACLRMGLLGPHTCSVHGPLTLSAHVLRGGSLSLSLPLNARSYSSGMVTILEVYIRSVAD